MALAAVGVSIAIFNQASRIAVFPLVSITTSLVAEEDTIERISNEVPKGENSEKVSDKNCETKELKDADAMLEILKEGSTKDSETKASMPEDGMSMDIFFVILYVEIIFTWFSYQWFLYQIPRLVQPLVLAPAVEIRLNRNVRSGISLQHQRR